MSVTEQYIILLQLARQADRLCNALRGEWYIAFHAGDTARMDRLDVIRLRAIARMERRYAAYRTLVYGGAE